MLHCALANPQANSSFGRKKGALRFTGGIYLSKYACRRNPLVVCNTVVLQIVEGFLPNMKEFSSPSNHAAP